MLVQRCISMVLAVVVAAVVVGCSAHSSTTGSAAGASGGGVTGTTGSAGGASGGGVTGTRDTTVPGGGSFGGTPGGGRFGGTTGSAGGASGGGAIGAGGTTVSGGGGFGGSGVVGAPSVFPPGGVTFPWPVFDGTIPDTPAASSGSNTWYCDAVNGNDTASGTSFATAKKTISAVLAITSLKAGDTILLGGGIYREYANWYGGPSGKQGAPIVVGSYGRGTGAPIVDGGLKPNTWTKYTAQGQTTVWQSSTTGMASPLGTKIGSSVPILGIYVNSGTSESALREVIHGQVENYGSEPPWPNMTQANIKDNSNNWYFDASGGRIYADFGGTLGTGDPNKADISLIYNSENGPSGHEVLISLGPGQSYYKFVGLTLRASSWNGVYTETSGITFDHCDIKFNGGASILFGYASGDTAPRTNNTVTNSRVWMNVLHNWPRFNNGNTGGGWPAAIGWSSQSNGLAQGNVIYQNGGEGLILGGSDFSGQPSVNNQVRQNVIFDNFSVNLYLDNTTNAKLEQNFVFNHPLDPTETFDGLLATSPGYDGDYSKRLTPVNLSLGDEPGSSYDNRGHLANITAVNNIFAGGKYGFLDYDDGTVDSSHGLKNCLIVNNTWILGSEHAHASTGYDWRHTPLDNGSDPSSNSILQNNIFATGAAEDDFVEVGKAAGPGINDDYNLYSGPGQWNSNGTLMTFANWKGAHTSWDQNSVNADARLQDVSEFFTKTAAEKLVYDWSKATPLVGSPVFGNGTTQPITTDFTGAARSAGSHDIGAISSH
jgi:Right handed beta helix region